MSEQQSPEVDATEMEAPAEEQQSTEEAATLPDDHPLVRTLAEQKRQIRELKAKATRLAELEEAQMTEAEKAEARVKAAEDRARDLEAANDRKDVAIDFRLSPEDAALLDDLTDPEAMRRLAGRLARQAAEDAGPRSPRPDPNQGRNGGPVASAEDHFVAFANKI